MWSADDGPYDGAHYKLARTLSSPQPLSRPHPPIIIGGSGERRTLRLVAKYADACNLFPSPELAHKLDVLRAHCEREGRDYDEIEKTTLLGVDAETSPAELLEQLRGLHDLGFTVAYVSVRGTEPLPLLEMLGSEVIAEIAGW